MTGVNRTGAWGQSVISVANQTIITGSVMAGTVGNRFKVPTNV